MRILDPAAGAGVLLAAVIEQIASWPTKPSVVHLVAYEVDEKLCRSLEVTLSHICVWGETHGLRITTEVHAEDFVLAHAAALRTIGGLFPHLPPEKAFDVVISNPPYFKLNKADPRAAAAAAVVHGQSNIYGLFMAVCAALLKQGGNFIFITPRSFASGPYFRLFREVFFSCVRPEHVHIFASRRDTFGRDEVLQENIIFQGIRQDLWFKREVQELVTISTSHGLNGLLSPARRALKLADVLDMNTSSRIMRLPETVEVEQILKRVDSWQGSLKAYGLQISTGPVVPFRATEFLDQEGSVGASHVPLLWMNHVRSMRVEWPINRRKPEYIKLLPETRFLLVPNKNYVLLRRFSAKEEERRLVAGPYMANTTSCTMLGLENHLNYIYRPNGTLSEDETFGLCALLNSELLDTYFRASNGNTQVSATELRAMPLPPLKTIAALGHLVRKTPELSLAALDALVSEILCDNPEQERVSAIG